MFTSMVGDDSCGVPPVPIPNTAVKTAYAESTWVATPWEDRKSLIDLWGAEVTLALYKNMIPLKSA